MKQNDDEIRILDLFASMILESIHEYIARCFAGVWYERHTELFALYSSLRAFQAFTILFISVDTMSFPVPPSS